MHDEIRSLGATLIAISPQTQEKNAEIHAKHRLEYPVLSDAGNAYAQQLGLTFTFPDDLRAIYEQFSLDVPGHNGDDSWTLPIPARFIVQQDGTITKVDADPDYTRRPEPASAIEALKALGAG